MNASSAIVSGHDPVVNYSITANSSCSKILIRRMRLAVIWSLILQLFLVFSFILVTNVELVQPLTWFWNCVNVILSFDVWANILLLVIIIYIQGSLCKTYYVTGPVFHSTRFLKIQQVFSTRNILMVNLHMMVGFTVFWVYSSISGKYAKLLVHCGYGQSESCLNENKFFLLIGGLWIGMYYFTRDYMFGSQNLSFPLIQQDKCYRIKAALKQNMTQSLRDSVLPTALFIMLYYLYGGFLRVQFIDLIGCRLESEPLDTVRGLINPRLVLSLWIFSSIFIIVLQIMELLFSVHLTEHCVFPVTTGASPPKDYISLIDSLKKCNTPITYHLGYLDLFILSTKCQQRREEIFTLSHPGGHPHSWKGVFTECTALIKTFTSDLNQALQQSANTEIITEPLAKSDVTNIHFHSHNIRKLSFPINPKDSNMRQNEYQSGIEVAFINLQNWFRLKLDQMFRKPYIAYFFAEFPDSRINFLICQCQPVVWAVQSLAFLSAASLTEDRFGIVQRNLSEIIVTIVSLKQALDKLFKQNLIVKKSFSNDPVDLQMKYLLRTSVKRSLYKLAVAFGPYIKELRLPCDIELQMNNFIAFREVL